MNEIVRVKKELKLRQWTEMVNTRGIFRGINQKSTK